MKKLILLLTVICLHGCDSDPERRKAIGDGGKYFFTQDGTGDKYIIQHQLGDNYSVVKCTTIFKDSEFCMKLGKEEK